VRVFSFFFFIRGETETKDTVETKIDRDESASRYNLIGSKCSGKARLPNAIYVVVDDIQIISKLKEHKRERQREKKSQQKLSDFRREKKSIKKKTTTLTHAF
jgi:hypothetical protein